MAIDGVIKFTIQLEDSEPPSFYQVQELCILREELYKLGWIGEENGIGHGNISMRIENSSSFIITGTQTGNCSTLKPDQFTTVTHYSLSNFSLICCGKVKASSESLTHASCYEAVPTIKFVAHIHAKKLWALLLKYNLCPKVPQDVSYGTPEMAKTIAALMNSNKNFIVMEGHEDGVIFWGNDIKSIKNTIRELKELSSSQ